VKKKLQVFVSSTYKDLIDERQAAVEAILKSGNIPAGMELFTAGNESQLQVITRWIDESDIYLLILGGRYGTIETNSGQSYTEIEYDYAVSQGKPYFSIVISDELLNFKIKQHGKEVIETENTNQYKKFREKVLTRMSSFFSETKDIKLAIHETIQEFKERYEFSGWVSARVLEKVEFLKTENQKITKQIEEIKSRKNEIRLDSVCL
jgi:nucleoside 2-deoxyribosyltransferase